MTSAHPWLLSLKTLARRASEMSLKPVSDTLNRVPALLFNAPAQIHSLADGKLADVAPTLLALMQVPQPREMTGHSLLSEASRPHILAAPRAVAAASA